MGSLTNSQPSLVVGCFRTTCQQSVKFHEHWGKYNPKWTFTQHVHPSVISRTYRLRNKHGDSKHNSVYILFLSRYVYIYLCIYMLCIYICVCVCVRCSKKICRTYAHKSLKRQDLYKQNMVRSWKFPRSLHEASTCVEWLVSIFPNCTSYLNYTTRQYIYIYSK